MCVCSVYMIESCPFYRCFCSHRQNICHVSRSSGRRCDESSSHLSSGNSLWFFFHSIIHTKKHTHTHCLLAKIRRHETSIYFAILHCHQRYSSKHSLTLISGYRYRSCRFTFLICLSIYFRFFYCQTEWTSRKRREKKNQLFTLPPTLCHAVFRIVASTK